MMTGKRSLSLLLAFVLLLGLLPMSVLAEETKTEQYIQDLISSGETEIYLDESVVLENDLTIPGNVMLMLRQGSITVPEGKTLFVNGAQLSSWASGTLTVEEGGTLINHGYMNVSGTVDIRGTYEGGEIHTYYWSNGANATITGVPDRNIWMHYVVEGDDPEANQAKFLENWALMENTNYGNYSQQIHGELTLPGDLTIPENCYFVLEVMPFTFTIPEGVKVVNNGSFSSYQDQTVQNNGTFENNGRLDVQGPWQGNQAIKQKMTQDQLEAKIAQAAESGNSYWLDREVVLERDMTVDAFFGIGNGGHLTVPEGKTLTLNKNSAGVEPGGTLEVLGSIQLNESIINVNTYGNGRTGTVIGVDMAYLCLNANVFSEEALREVIQVAADTNYNFDCIYVAADIKLTSDITVPEFSVLHVVNGATLTIGEGSNVTVDGEVYVWQGQTLCNNGSLTVNTYLGVHGTLTNNSQITVDGNLVLEATSTVKNNGSVTANGEFVSLGTWEGNDPIQTHVHSYTETVTAPTCTTGGYTTYTCTCGHSYTGNEVPATGHSFGQWETTASATCTAEGSRTRSCACGEKETEAIPAKGHTEVIDEAVAATCTAEGKTEGKHCSVCNEVLKAQETVPAKGHTEVIDEAVAATCTAEGKTEGKHCSICNAVLKAQETVPAKGHTEVIDEAIAATCTAEGKTEGKHCSVCNEVLKAQETVPAKGHSFGEWETVKAPTATEEGLKERRCACGEVESEAIPATGEVTVLWGDVNGDGFVDSFDASLIMKYDVMLIGDEDLDLTAADVSGDGFVDSYDASLILKYDVFLITKFPVEE